MNGKKLLDIRNLSVDYYAASGTVHALDNVSITLERGQILGLAGESGSGKSTLTYAVTRLLHPPAAITGGEVWYYPRSDMRRQRGKSAGAAESRALTDGPIDILQLSPAQLRAFRWSELAIVFQSAMNALNPVLTVGAQINDVLRTHQLLRASAPETPQQLVACHLYTQGEVPTNADFAASYEAAYEAMPGRRRGE